MKYRIIGGVAITVALAGCGANGNSPTAPTGVASISSNVLQFEVGTVNLYGKRDAGLNVVVTYRQPSSGFDPGGSGALVSSPTIHLPNLIPFTAANVTTVPYDPTSTAYSSPSHQEMLGHLISSTSQASGATAVTTFGQSGGAYALGIEPFNALASGDAVKPPISLYGQAFCPRLQLGCTGPYPVPLYDDVYTAKGQKNVNALAAWGGPPAFDILGNGQSPVGSSQVAPGFAGLFMGLDIFAMKPYTANYGLTLLVATQNAGNYTQTARAHLNSSIGLPTAAAAKFFANGKGGGTLAFKMPAGATEAYIQVADFGPLGPIAGCNTASNMASSSSSSGSSGGAFPVTIYYTIVARHSGSYALPDSAGPGGTPSICSGAQNDASTSGKVSKGDAFIVQTIAFDYPLYEASETGPKSSSNPSPLIRGNRGQDDVTVSPADCEEAPKNSGPATSCPSGTLPFPGQPQ
jgi:hypothetical protein